MIKAKAEDFFVKEVFNISISEGRFTYFTLWKKGHTTMNALKLISKRFKIPLKKFGFAGLKDRQAITIQTCSVYGQVNDWEGGGVSIKIIGKGDMPISLGDHQGNFFRIVVRDILNKPTLKKDFVNYFGDQRFSKNNIEIGKALVKKDFSKAAGLCDDLELREYFHKNPTNPVGALRKVPRKTLRLFVHAYQSFLWNKGVEEYITQGGKGVFPLFGFGVEYPDKLSKGIVERIAKEEKLKARDFIIPQIPELSAEGGLRDVKMSVKALKIGDLEDDELHAGKKKVEIEFTLGRGSYATELIKQLGF